MEVIKKMLLLPNEKHLIIGSNPEWIESFGQKVFHSLSECEIEMIAPDPFIVQKIKEKSSKGSLLIYCSSLNTFIQHFELYALQNTLLHKVSLTFTEISQSDIEFNHVALFSNYIYEITGSSCYSYQNIQRKIIAIDLLKISHDALINYLHSNYQHKELIFNIDKTEFKVPRKIAQMSVLNKVKKKVNKKKKKTIKSFNQNSLISISGEVKKFIQKNKKTTPLKTTNYIVELLKKVKTLEPSKKKSVLLKNIQRRVYDAINVMCATGIIIKQKNLITYVGEEKTTLESRFNCDINQSIIDLKSQIDSKEHKLIQGIRELDVYEYCNRLNRSDLNRLNSPNQIALPFDYIDIDKQQSSSIILKDYQCDNIIRAVDCNNSIDSYHEFIKKISNAIQSKSHKQSRELLPKECIDYYNEINEKDKDKNKGQDIQHEPKEIVQPLIQNLNRSTFYLDFNSIDCGKDISSNDNIHDDSENIISKNTNFDFDLDFHPFDLLKIENNFRQSSNS